jgi:hypothetical protein
VAVADIFDAITAPRPYRPAASHQHAFAVLSSEQGTRLDSDVVQAFVRCYSGRRTVALWAALSAIAASVLARSKGVLARRRLSLRDLLSTTTAVTAATAAALAAPLSAPATHPRPSPTTAAALPSIVTRAADTHRVRHHAHRASVAPPVKPVVAPPRHRSAAVHRRPRPARVHTAPPPPRTTTHQPPPPTTPSTPAPPPQTSTTTPPPRTTTTTTTTPPPTTTPSPGPTSKEQCRHGGYVQFGFRNQGQCISWVVHHRA